MFLPHCLIPYLWTTKAEQFSLYYNFFPLASLPVHGVFFMQFVGLATSKIKDDLKIIVFWDVMLCNLVAKY